MNAQQLPILCLAPLVAAAQNVAAASPRRQDYRDAGAGAARVVYPGRAVSRSGLSRQAGRKQEGGELQTCGRHQQKAAQCSCRGILRSGNVGRSAAPVTYDAILRATVERLRAWFAGDGEVINAAVALRMKGLT